MKLKALVIDDSKVMRMMVMKNLKQAKIANFSFIEAEDGEAAIEKFVSEKPDILFVDWNIPKKSGIEFVREVRAKDAKVPIVMVTSEKAMGKMIEAVDEAGANDYICKPFKTEDFTHKIGKIIDEM